MIASGSVSGWAGHKDELGNFLGALWLKESTCIIDHMIIVALVVYQNCPKKHDRLPGGSGR